MKNFRRAAGIAIGILALSLAGCEQPTSGGDYIVEAVFENGDIDVGLVMVLKGLSFVDDATVTIDGQPAVYSFLGYGIDGGMTLAPGQTVEVRVVADGLDVSGSVTIPGDFAIDPTSVSQSSSVSTGINYSGLVDGPDLIEASVGYPDSADEDGWSTSVYNPTASGTLIVPTTAIATDAGVGADLFDIEVSAVNTTMLDAGLGSVLIGSNQKTCSVDYTDR